MLGEEIEGEVANQGVPDGSPEPGGQDKIKKGLLGWIREMWSKREPFDSGHKPTLEDAGLWPDEYDSPEKPV